MYFVSGNEIRSERFRNHPSRRGRCPHRPVCCPPPSPYSLCTRRGRTRRVTNVCPHRSAEAAPFGRCEAPEGSWQSVPRCAKRTDCHVAARLAMTARSEPVLIQRRAKKRARADAGIPQGTKRRSRYGYGAGGRPDPRPPHLQAARAMTGPDKAKAFACAKEYRRRGGARRRYLVYGCSSNSIYLMQSARNCNEERCIKQRTIYCWKEAGMPGR